MSLFLQDPPANARDAHAVKGLDFEDRRILHALQLSPRAAWSDLGRILDRHPQTVRQRYERLYAAGAAWTVGHLSGDPAQGVLAFVTLRCPSAALDPVAEALGRVPQVVTVERLTGDWDLRATVVALSTEDFLRDTAMRIQAIPGVERTDVEIATRLIAAGHQWTLDALDPAERAAVSALEPLGDASPRSPSAVLLDALPHLQRNGRISYQALSEATGHHPTTIRRHLEQAQRSGLLFLRCEVAQDLTSYPLSVQWFARAEPTALARLRAFLREQPELRLAYESTGEANVSWALWLKTPADIARLEWELHRQVPGVRVLRTVLGTRTLKRLGHTLTPRGRRVVRAPQAG